MKILNIVGARPNFMKVAPIHRCLQQFEDIESKIVHTGQHYNQQMSGVFFEQLELAEPDYFLGISGGSQTEQMAGIMLEFEKVLKIENPDVVLVVGDVTSTIACALTAVQQKIPVAHVEAGLRSGDKRMPEEINRMMTDCISDHLFVTEQSALENLKRENISSDKIHFVGNVMIDSLVYHRPKLDEIKILETFRLHAKSYVLITMHRPGNVDHEENLKKILKIVKQLTFEQTVLFPVHPRTLKNMVRYGLSGEFENIPGLQIVEPQGYLEFLKLIENASLIITDSGGIQEESTFLGIPCITLRENTERPVTIETGTNYLLENLETEPVMTLARQILKTGGKKGGIPALWDGNAAERIAGILREKYN